LQPWKTKVVENNIIVMDATEYHELALSFLSNKSFIEFGAFRTPGYPVFVALLYGMSSECVWFVLLIQLLLNVCTLFSVCPQFIFN